MMIVCMVLFFFFKQKTAYEMRISDWSSDVCSSDLTDVGGGSDGIYLYFRPELRLGDSVLLNVDSPYSFFLFTLACLVLVWAFLAMLMRSRFGAALPGIRVNETAIRSAGSPTFN